MAQKNYYEIFGVSRDADQETIKRAYRKLAMQYHPDRNPGKEKWANDKFKGINEAFSILGDPEKRWQYDQFGTVGSAGDIFSSPFTRSTFEDLMKDFGGSGLGFDFLDNIFGDALRDKGFSFKIYRGGTGGQSRTNLNDMFGQTQYSPRQDVHYEMTISKEKAAKGLEKDLKRGGKKLRVKIPAGIKNGMTVRLRNALQVTDRQPGDIMLLVKVK